MKPELLKNINPEIIKAIPAWKRIKVLIEEDEDQYTNDTFFFPLPNEKHSTTQKRKSVFKRSFINPTQALIKCKGDFVFKKGVVRNTTNQSFLDFIENADRSGNSLDEFMHHQVSTTLGAYGTVFAVLDKPHGVFINKQDELANGLPYLDILDPLSVKDFQYDSNGQLEWFRYVIIETPDRTDPFNYSEGGAQLYVTWTKTDYFLHTEKGALVETFTHGFGVVPVIIKASFILDSSSTIGKSTFWVSSNYIIMGNNLLSASNNEIFKNAASLLIMKQNDFDDSNVVKELDPTTNKKVLVREAHDVSDAFLVQDMKDAPSYLTKDLAIVGVAKIQSEYYFQLAIDSENCSKSIENGASVQSGVAKAYDFSEMDGMLASHAQELESFEKNLFEVLSAELGIQDDISIQYPRTFDVRSYGDKIQLIKDLNDINYPSVTAIEQVQKSIISDITSSHDIEEEIKKEIESSIPGVSVPPNDQNPLDIGTNPIN